MIDKIGMELKILKIGMELKIQNKDYTIIG
jgi:hypothetical protein